MEQRKRIYRELDADTKQKISRATVGKAKSAAHKQHISQAMKKYWSTVPSKHKPITVDDYFNTSR